MAGSSTSRARSRPGLRTAVAAGAVLLLALATACGDRGATAVDATASPRHTASASPSASAPTSAARPTLSTDGIVAGFPGDLLPPAPDSTVTLTTYSPRELAGGRPGHDVSINGHTGHGPDEVVAFYRDRLVAAGFTAHDTPVGAETHGALFTRGDQDGDRITVTATSVDGTTQFTAGGTLADH